jgi:hypothetical protein
MVFVRRTKWNTAFAAGLCLLLLAVTVHGADSMKSLSVIAKRRTTRLWHLLLRKDSSVNVIGDGHGLLFR